MPPRASSGVSSIRLKRVASRRSPVVGAASQIIYGLSNFVLFVLISAMSSDEVLGATSLVYLQVLLWMALARAVSSEPLLLRPALLNDRKPMLAGALGVACWAALGAAILTAASIVFPDLRPGAPLAFAAVVPMAILHDFGRGIFLAERSPLRALEGDATWLGVQVASSGMLALAGELTVVTAILAWGFGAAVSGSVNLVRSGARLERHRIGRYQAEVGPLTRALAGAATVTFVSRNVTYYLIGFVGGLVVLGDLRRALLLFGPLTALYLGLSASIVPWMARHPESVGRQVVRLAAGCVAVSTLWALAACMLTVAELPQLSRVIGTDVVTVALLGTALVLQGVATSSIAGLRVLNRAHLQTLVVTTSLAVMALLAIVLTRHFGSRGGAAALAAGNGLEAVLSALALGVVLRNRSEK